MQETRGNRDNSDNTPDTILATTSSFGKNNREIRQEVEARGLKLVTNPFGRKLTEAELISLLAEHRPIGLLAGTEPVTRDVIARSESHLRVISRVGVGWDNVDHGAAEEFGVKVYRTEGVLDQAVAELTLGMILAALRNIVRHDREIRAGIWKKYTGSLLAGKKVGIIGYGAIGQKVGELVHAFGAHPLYTDICSIDSSSCAVCVSFDQLLEQADIITVHASGCTQILGEKGLARCKKGVIVVNTARGGLINESALQKNLQTGQVAYGCLDVFDEEPYHGPLTEADNVIMTSHIGSYAMEARLAMEGLAVANLLAGFKTLSLL